MSSAELIRKLRAEVGFEPWSSCSARDNIAVAVLDDARVEVLAIGDERVDVPQYIMTPETALAWILKHFAKEKKP